MGTPGRLRHWPRRHGRVPADPGLRTGDLRDPGSRVPGQLYQPAAGAIVVDVVDKERRSRAYGLLYWAVNIGFSVAAVLGGALAQRDFTLLFWVDAVVCVMFGLMIWWRLPPDEPRNADRPVPSGGYRDVLRDRVLTYSRGDARVSR
ncbi:MFS transporter [Nocardiopsis algeriensis]|uniref:MFS transporter n=1 Tax=Nocardiopsis algeriensis TaxID=1478215 RepID=UPI001FEBB5D7|nr:MFS transporter [Nocardiopsis algeriensis]